MGFNEKVHAFIAAKFYVRLTEQFGENANRFKRGIVYETDKEFGDKVNITVIATGFEMKRLNEITDVKIGNIIMIDSNFKYSRDVALNSGVDLPEVSSTKIGFNSSSIKNTFSYKKEGKPALLLGEKDSKREYETVAAIRRKTQK